MDQEKIELEFRIQAIEYVLIHIGKISLLAAAGFDPEASNYAARNLRAAAAHKLNKETFPGLNAAWSDHVASELQAAVDKLLAGIEAVVVKTFDEPS